MTKKSALLELIPQMGILPLFFHENENTCCQALAALYEAGIRAFEYVDRGEAALNNFKMMRALCDSDLPGMYLGIGTIKTGEKAGIYLDEGADFLVSPGVVENVAQVANRNDVLYIPGCMTPTEIMVSEALGAQMIKLFPGNNLGPAFVEAVRVVFPGILFMPTGGVDFDEASISRWFASGVCALGGSKLITRAMLDEGRFTELRDVMAAALVHVDRTRHKR